MPLKEKETKSIFAYNCMSTDESVSSAFLFSFGGQLLSELIMFCLNASCSW